jgi:hypothetical protein
LWEIGVALVRGMLLAIFLDSYQLINLMCIRHLEVYYCIAIQMDFEAGLHWINSGVDTCYIFEHLTSTEFL